MARQETLNVLSISAWNCPIGHPNSVCQYVLNEVWRVNLLKYAAPTDAPVTRQRRGDLRICSVQFLHKIKLGDSRMVLPTDWWHIKIVVHHLKIGCRIPKPGPVRNEKGGFKPYSTTWGVWGSEDYVCLPELCHFYSHIRWRDFIDKERD